MCIRDSIIREGESGASLFIVISGSVELYQHKGNKDTWIKTLHAGELFGLKSFLLGDDYASCHPETRKAVDEFVSSNGYFMDLLRKPGNKYPIYKIVKQ